VFSLRIIPPVCVFARGKYNKGKEEAPLKGLSTRKVIKGVSISVEGHYSPLNSKLLVEGVDGWIARTNRMSE
jgi:hypothetical protein